MTEDDSRPQEQIILGFALQGTKDNTNIWAKFRSALGLTPGLRVPQELFSDGLLARVAEEVDAAFHGKRDIRTLNGRALVESYRHRLTNEQIDLQVSAGRCPTSPPRLPASSRTTSRSPSSC